MASIPPVVERCKTCGAELFSEAPICWLCRTPRGEARVVTAAAVQTAPRAPGFVMAGNLFSYGMLLGCGAVVALACLGMMIDSPENMLGVIVLVVGAGIPIFATLVRTVVRHQQSGSASFLDSLLTLLAYSAISASILMLLSLAAVGALVIYCFYAVFNEGLRH